MCSYVVLSSCLQTSAEQRSTGMPLRAMKETAVFDEPFVKKSALIGTESLPRDFYEDMTRFSRRELPIFKTRELWPGWPQMRSTLEPTPRRRVFQ